MSNLIPDYENAKLVRQSSGSHQTRALVEECRYHRHCLSLLTHEWQPYALLKPITGPFVALQIQDPARWDCIDIGWLEDLCHAGYAQQRVVPYLHPSTLWPSGSFNEFRLLNNPVIFPIDRQQATQLPLWE